MSFISFTFAIFFFVFIVLYHVAARLAKNVVPAQQFLLLAAGFVFYAIADLRFLPFLVYVIAVSYVAARCSRNRLLLVLFIVADLLPLLFFKYSPRNWRGGLLFPLGLSFFTFQGISYVADCYTKKITAERNILPVALFIGFFPVISSGPIQRAGKLIPQLKMPRCFDYADATDGMKLFAWGMLKKLCVADSLAVYVNSVYGDVAGAHGLALLLATVLYSFQIYCDFSGYSDMATGLARYMGFDAGRNFDHPYLAQSVGDFWRRWHISLSSWLRDYVYIPLGGSRVALPRIYLNLVVTFLVSGIWHGAGWHFVIWGLLHGLCLCVERMLKPWAQKLKIVPAVRIAVTFCLVSFAWVFFRAGSAGEALAVLRKLGEIPRELLQLKQDARGIFLLSSCGGFAGFLKVLFPLAVLLGVEIVTRNKSGLEIIKAKNTAVRWILYAACIMALVQALPLTFSVKDLSSYSTNFIYQNF